MKKIILAAILLAGGSLATTLDDVPYDTTMWSALDPFGFTTLRATAPSNWVNAVVLAHGTNMVVHTNKLNVSTFAATNAAVWSAITELAIRAPAWNEAYDFIATGTAGIANNSNRINTANVNIANNSNRVNTANSHIAANSNGLVTANANIANNSNGLVSANARILAGSNTVVALDAKLVATSNVLVSAMGSAGISAPTGTNIALAVVAPYTNRIVTAWQNPPSATNWTWTSDGTNVTLTSYNFTTGGTDVYLPEMLDGLPVTGFGDIFSNGSVGTQLTSIFGGANIKTVPDLSFAVCASLTNVSLQSATKIGSNAFSLCTALESVSFFSALELSESAFGGCSSLTTAYFPSLKTIGNRVFVSCVVLSDVYIPSVTSIGSESFALCGSLVSISVRSATSLGNYAFIDCPSLSSVEIPNVSNIGNGTFGSCVSMVSIELPSITTIGAYAFSNCQSLNSVRFFKNAPSEGGNIYDVIPENQVTNYVTHATATGWGATFGGMPVVRMPVTSTEVNAGTVISITSTTTGTNSVGALTLGGVTRSTWPDGGSSAPLAWTPITTVPVSAIATARVTTAKSIYYFESANAVSFTNDLSALSLNCTTNYQWTIVFNATGTNACNSTNWYGVVDFVGGPPELTCTGRYEYACDTSCGTRIRVRQTYPTVYAWEPALHAGTRNAWSTTLSIGPVVMLNQTDTNATCYIVRNDFTKPVFFKFHTNFTGLDAAHATNRVYARMGLGNNATAGIYPSNFPTVALGTNSTTCVNYMYIPNLVWPNPTTGYGFTLHYYRTNSIGTAQRVDLGEMQWTRTANELEQVAGTNKAAWASAYQ